MATFVIVHGALSGAHAWRWVRLLSCTPTTPTHVTAPQELTVALTDLVQTARAPAPPAAAGSA